MAKRTCQPDADLKKIWQRLLPGTPFPACETPENSGTDPCDNALPADAREKPQSYSSAR